MWEPALESVSSPLRELIDHDLRSFRDLRPRRHKGGGNINIRQQALKDLKSRQDIIIKPADKGGQIVLQDRTNYVLEATRQLHHILSPSHTADVLRNPNDGQSSNR